MWNNTDINPPNWKYEEKYITVCCVFNLLFTGCNMLQLNKLIVIETKIQMFLNYNNVKYLFDWWETFMSIFGL